MEINTIQNNSWSLFSAEFLGTFFYLITVFFSSWFLHDPLTFAIGISCGLIIAITAFGRYSGGHFNPALTISYFIFVQKENRKISVCLIMILAQFTGALGGGLILSLVIGNNKPKLFPIEENLSGAFLNEVFFTFMFFTVIFCVKNSHHNVSEDNLLCALACSVTLCGVTLYGGNMSGACYNPVVGVSFIFWNCIAHSNFSYIKSLPFYFIAPITGGMLAGILARFFIQKEDEFSSVKEAKIKTLLLI